MGELRRDPVVGRWVIVDTDHPGQSNGFEKEDHTPKQEAKCQFCYGRENQTPPEIEAARPKDSKPNSPGWSVRVIPNKFPALQIEGELNKRGIGIFDMSNGVGAHEIVIETPDHRKVMADFTNEELLEVIKKFKSRYVSLSHDKRLKYILIFKNFGESAGASMEHGHSQIIALPMVPKYVLEELEGAEHYFEYRGRCVFCDMINQEYQDKDRIVTENKDFISFCPFAPRFPFESWIIPKEHSAHLEDISDEKLYNLAGILKEMLYRLKVTLSNPSYNFFLHLAPLHYEHNESYHWHIEIIPKLTQIAGFEWGTGFYIVSTPPDVAAKQLREVRLAKHG